MQNFVEISKKEFYDLTLTKDIILKSTGDYPYTTLWSLRNGDLIGKSRNGNYLICQEFLKKHQ